MSFTQVVESYRRSMPMASTSEGHEKSIDALQQICISVSRDVIPINNFNLSLLSATKSEITQARQDSSAVHGNGIKQRVFAERSGCHFLCVCASRLFSSDNKVAMKIMLSSKSERCYYSFHRDSLFQMTYLMQCGRWFVPLVTFFCELRHVC